MYNSFIFKKHSIESSESLEEKNKMSKRNLKYRNNIRPALIEKYSRRINNFIVKLQDNKNELYEYRQETQSKAHQLLKEIDRKERYLGQPRIKLKDSKDWNSIYTSTDRLQMQKNKKTFSEKFGSDDIAFRSIASQSSYVSAHSTQFRHREKSKEIHPSNMSFTAKYDLFQNNKRQIHLKKKVYKNLNKGDSLKEKYFPIRRLSTQTSKIHQDEIKSNNHSLFTFGSGQYKNEDNQQSASNHRQQGNHHAPPQIGNKTKKVYFKTVIDIQQNSKQPAVKKAIHQILVRFGISRIKDIKKQAMAQTDNLQSDDF